MKDYSTPHENLVFFSMAEECIMWAVAQRRCVSLQPEAFFRLYCEFLGLSYLDFIAWD